MTDVDGKPTTMPSTMSSGGLVNRLFPHLTPGGNIQGEIPPSPSPVSSSRRSSAEGCNNVDASASGSRTGSVNHTADPGSFSYKLQESDSASSLGSLADKVADFVEPERVPEKIPHKATGEKKKTRLFPDCFD